MGVYINMEMPKNCQSCRFCFGDICLALKDQETGDCPLVPVPPHGELIERDKLREKEFIHDGDAYAVVMSRDIRNAPTIIPASCENPAKSRDNHEIDEAEEGEG